MKSEFNNYLMIIKINNVTTISLFFLFFIMTLFATYGQRPNSKAIKFDIRQPPSNPLPTNVKTYYGEYLNKTSNFRTSTLSSDDPEKEGKRIVLYGYKRAESKLSADVLLTITVNGANYEKSIESYKGKKKQKDGTVIEVTEYTFRVIAKLNTSVEMRDLRNDKVLILQEGLEMVDQWESSFLESKALAEKGLKVSGIPNVPYQYASIYKKRFNEFVDRVNNDYGFPIVNFKFQIATGKARKFEYEDLNSAYSKIKNLASKYPVSDMSNEYRLELQECVEIWKEALNEYQPNKKKARINDKIAGALFMNIAKAYFMMQDWKMVYTFCDKAKSFKTEMNSANNLYERTAVLEERYYGIAKLN
ncbi:hypothetical protein Q4534_00905 [Cyclobacterium sp. 1_MG-2023]|uniref:hypothetical protein n=1 Tax=Cyclobacterium sp. 1_MG-2023 TaxID=3062681 RepID=UPI0026E1DD1D|nr:hypothetical protein [Cyclobacterium sp. 1_MG-2023]MDO6435937.1 hypothetical protein [Cyclobacterium sp. 1_MG-2023]